MAENMLCYNIYFCLLPPSQEEKCKLERKTSFRTLCYPDDNYLKN